MQAILENTVGGLSTLFAVLSTKSMTETIPMGTVIMLQTGHGRVTTTSTLHRINPNRKH